MRQKVSRKKKKIPDEKNMKRWQSGEKKKQKMGHSLIINYDIKDFRIIINRGKVIKKERGSCN